MTPGRFRAVILDDGYASYDTERAVLGAAGAEVVLRPCRGDARRAREAVTDADAVLVRETPVDAGVVAAMTRCRVIVRYGVGVDNVDLEAARARRIPVANVPDYGVEDVSDHTVALLLAVARRIVTRDRAVRAGAWGIGPAEPVHRVAGRVLGLIGYGRIGRAVHRKLGGFGLARVLVHDPFLDAAPPGVELVDLERLVAEADYVCLHCPLTPATHHLIDAPRLRAMKPTAILVNAARGPIVDEAALVEALREGRIFGAGLDVFEREPLPAHHPLRALDRVVLSDHTAWYSEESIADLQRKAAEEAARGLRGEPLRSWVNAWT
ncbi:MAG TPA: C-terminal binding protein [Candidatus Tectomicrobia bacterium]|nr:C-terminal binding protein [Candidatus Tectomicrobia bacterium]